MVEVFFAADAEVSAVSTVGVGVTIGSGVTPAWGVGMVSASVPPLPGHSFHAQNSAIAAASSTSAK